jgi:hypothetical protein
MRLAHAALIVLLLAPALLSAQENLGSYEDRIAVEDVMARYVWTVDSLDADGTPRYSPKTPSSTRTAASARGMSRSGRLSPTSSSAPATTRRLESRQGICIT